ncbi:MAG: hypothetical protein JNJ77_16595 [Planctomycetia bacterium]|nr:hypothetical protein [Planctomycetia bacterium]
MKKLQQYHEHLELTSMLWDKCLSTLTMLTLNNAGFHLHGSSWRLKRPGKEAMNATPSPNPTNEHPKTKEQEASTTQNASVSEDELEQMMEKEADLWDLHGDMFQKSIDHLLTAYLGDNVKQKVSLKRKLKKLKNEWKGGGSALEVAHAERLSILWLQVYLAEMLYTEASVKQKTNFSLIRHLEKQYDSAQVRYERGLKSLVTIQVMLERKNQLAQKITNSMRSKLARSRVKTTRHGKPFNRVFADSTLQN